MARLIFASTGLAIVVGISVTASPPGHDSRSGESTVRLVSLQTQQAGQSDAGLPKEVTAHPEFKAAGVCARCHVVQVLEWGISKHVAEQTTCQKCHGPSRAHVANERNEVKPDSVPRGEQMAKTCNTCHEGGCPATDTKVSCQKCHHHHALLDTTKQPKSDNSPFAQLLARTEIFRKHMNEGESRVKLGDWKAAQKNFQDALALRPGDSEALERLAFTKRRLDPRFPGFTVVGEAFDSKTGLPKEAKVSGLDIPMVLIPAGEFDLGTDRLPDSRPVSTVAVPAFYLGKYEVTQAQWRAVMGSNPSVHQGKAFAKADQMPVEVVSWNDCQGFIKRLNARVPGGGFRLPTEAEWEYACRAGSNDTPSNATLEQSGWFRGNSRRESLDDASQKRPNLEGMPPDAWAPRPVGGKKANAWGLYDMQGNVEEWCSSLFTPYPYDASDGRESRDAPGMRVLRGGGFADPPEELDPALRHKDRPQRHYRWRGLRLARDLPQ
jgi:formylglycine-generating enzyme required for sulfatase activity